MTAASAAPRLMRTQLLRMRPAMVTAAQLAPATAVLVGLFLVPLAVLVGVSFFKYVPGRLYEKTFTWENYVRAFSDAFYRDALFTTLKLSAWTVGLTVAIAYPLALYLLSARPAVRALVLAIVITPLFTSVVVRAYGWTIMLGDTGPLNSALSALGLPQIDLSRNFAAVVIGMVHIELPFMLLPVLAALRRVPADVVEASRSLGAGPIRTIVSIHLPISAPGVAAGCALVFGMTVSAFIEPSILGGPQIFLLAGVAYGEVTSKLDWPQGAALGYELLLVALVVATVIVRLGRPKWQERG
jgi:putative spermidine/putrescine transport system permease protein